MKQKILNALERFSRAMLVPLSYLSAAGMVLVVGALLTSSTMRQLFPILEWQPLRVLGQLLYHCMMLLVNNLSLLFCVGVAAALARQQKHQAALIALMGYLVYLIAGNVGLNQHGLLADPNELNGLYGTGQTMVLGIQTMDMGVTGGLLLGLAAGWIYNHTCNRQFQGIWSQLCSGVRWSFVCVCAFAAALGYGSCFFMPPIQWLVSLLTGFIARSGNVGLFLYGFLERLLIPTGLHHLVYTPFQFSELGGSLTVGSVTYTGAYAVLMTEYNLGLPFSESAVWMYTGFTKTFGYLGITAAFIVCARKENRRKTAAALVPLALTASLASITEPLDFLFCFTVPLLWVVHSAIAGLFVVMLHLCHVTGFTANLLGSLLMNLTAGVKSTNYPTLYLLAACEILVYFVVFTALIKMLDLPTPGRAKQETVPQPETPDPQAVQQLIEGLGGAGNIAELDHCFTRLRITLIDPGKLEEAKLAALPNSGMVKQGSQVQIVYGLRVRMVWQAVREQLHRTVLC